MGRNAAALRSIYPEADIKIWRDTDIRNFLEEFFEPDVLEAYDTLVPYSYKCDLARFALLYVLGGMYVDLGVYMQRPWQIPLERPIAAFRDVTFVSPNWTAVQTGLLWAEPGREEFRLAIEEIIHNCRTRYYGANPLYPTGPVVLGRAFLKVMTDQGRAPSVDDQHVGACRCVTPEAEMLNVAYVSKEGAVVALRSKRKPGDLSHLGIKGANNYNQIWSRRQAYGEPVSSWQANDLQIQVQNGAFKQDGLIHLPEQVAQSLTYGPHITVEPGHYEFSLQFEPGTEFDFLRLDITTAGGARIQKSSVLRASAMDEDGRCTFELHVPERLENVEFVLHQLGTFKGALRAFQLRHRKRWSWSAAGPQIKSLGAARQTPEGIAFSFLSRGGRINYGPYASIPAGRYALKLFFSADTVFSHVKVDVATGAAHQTHTRNLRKFSDLDKDHALTVPLVFDGPMEDVEFRLHVNRFFKGKLLQYQLNEI
ncbi:glycosyltransferase family 32 protein [Oecophyllibacter saccharovorans]|uniref:glycosyltransferase family 32 protein n=1 Tax=Oecophyllibacter saccharovorans TaxID=2558360 RepID=UPI00143D5703|nr:glycosyltransferase [Oecophyllibacter saccharovorans]